MFGRTAAVIFKTLGHMLMVPSKPRDGTFMSKFPWTSSKLSGSNFVDWATDSDGSANLFNDDAGLMIGASDKGLTAPRVSYINPLSKFWSVVEETNGTAAAVTDV